MSQVLVELYWADWCGYCIRFKPVWKEIVQMAKNGEIKKNNLPVDILFKDYLHTQDMSKYKNPVERTNSGKSIEQIEQDMIKMKEDNINSYPTIKINGKDYDGPREKSPFLQAILEEAVPMSRSKLKKRGRNIEITKKTTVHRKKFKLKQGGGGHDGEASINKDYERLYKEFKMKYTILKNALNK